MAELMKEKSMQSLPLLPLKNSALFPGLLMPLSVGRTSSIAAVDAALATEEKEIVIVAQRDAEAKAVTLDDGAFGPAIGRAIHPGVRIAE